MIINMKGKAMIKAAIFDMDGLMVHTEPIWDETFFQTLESHGLEKDQVFRDSARGTSGIVLIRNLQKRYPQCDAERFVEEWTERVFEAVKQGAPARKGLFRLLDYLNDRSIKCIVASSSDMRLIDAQWNAHKLDKWFEGRVSAQEVAHSKPEPDVFLLACERLGVDPSEAIVYEDSNAGCRAAIAGGIKCIMVPDDARPDTDIEDKLVAVCSDLDEVRLVMDDVLLDEELKELRRQADKL